MIDYQAFVFTVDCGLITIDCLVTPYGRLKMNFDGFTRQILGISLRAI
jgi:hypothetical protein